MTLAATAFGFNQALAGKAGVHLIVWCVLLGASIALIVLARTRWREQHPLEKCAVLSLIVHLLLACMAMMVHVVVGQGGDAGGGAPIRVRIVSEQSPLPAPMDRSIAEAEVAPPPLLEAVDPEPDLAAQEPLKHENGSDTVEPAEPAASMNDEPRTASVKEASKVLPVAVGTVPKVHSAESPDGESVDAAPSKDVAAASEGNPAEAPPAAMMAGITQAPDSAAGRTSPGATHVEVDHAYALRAEADRIGLVESQGGSRETEAAVASALRWLAGAQSSDGRWDASRFGAGREFEVHQQNRGGAGANADTGISALAILAFLGAGHTHQSGEYPQVVDRGLDFLIQSQAPDGNLFGHAELYAQMYCHSMATFALAECLAITGDKRLESAVRRATNFSLRAQHPSAGGWRYRVGDIGDTSQLGWQVMALASAERGGIDVASRTWTGIERFLRSVRRGQQGGLASYRPDGPASTSMTAEALYCRALISEVTQAPFDERAAREATAQLLKSLPDKQLVNLYYWYYATLALHHRHTTSESARSAWLTWNHEMTTVLLDSQVATGTDAGSWEPNCLWGGYGGRIYTTSLATLCLEVYYRYAPPVGAHDAWIATEPQSADRIK